MKRLIVLTAICTVLAASGCGGEGSNPSDADDGTPSSGPYEGYDADPQHEYDCEQVPQGTFC